MVSLKVRSYPTFWSPLPFLSSPLLLILFPFPLPPSSFLLLSSFCLSHLPLFNFFSNPNFLPISSALSSPSFPFSSPHFIFHPFLSSALLSCLLVFLSLILASPLCSSSFLCSDLLSFTFPSSFPPLHPPLLPHFLLLSFSESHLVFPIISYTPFLPLLSSVFASPHFLLCSPPVLTSFGSLLLSSPLLFSLFSPLHTSHQESPWDTSPGCYFSDPP